jgi:hypothetical protein
MKSNKFASGFSCGKNGISHNKNPYRKFAGEQSSALHERWLADWKRGRALRLSNKKLAKTS